MVGIFSIKLKKFEKKIQKKFFSYFLENLLKNILKKVQFQNGFSKKEFTFI